MRAKRQAETEEEREGRRLQDAQAEATKRQSASVKQKDAEAMRTKRQAQTMNEISERLKDAQTKKR